MSEFPIEEFRRHLEEHPVQRQELPIAKLLPSAIDTIHFVLRCLATLLLVVGSIVVVSQALRHVPKPKPVTIQDAALIICACQHDETLCIDAITYVIEEKLR